MNTTLSLRTLLLALTLLGSACGGVEGDEAYDEADQAAVAGSAAPSSGRRNGNTGTDLAGHHVCNFAGGGSLICCANGTLDAHFTNNQCAFCGDPDCHDSGGRRGATARVPAAR